MDGPCTSYICVVPGADHEQMTLAKQERKKQKSWKPSIQSSLKLKPFPHRDYFTFVYLIIWTFATAKPFSYFLFGNGSFQFCTNYYGLKTSYSLYTECGYITPIDQSCKFHLLKANNWPQDCCKHCNNQVYIFAIISNGLALSPNSYIDFNLSSHLYLVFCLSNQIFIKKKKGIMWTMSTLKVISYMFLKVDLY